MFDVCAVCGLPVGTDSVVADEFYAGVWCHRECLNSSDGDAWRRRQAETDPAYARYLRLSSVSLAVDCPSCGATSRISAKARGMAAGSWEACCTACHRFTDLNGYAHARDYDAVVAVEQRFLRDQHDETWRPQMREIAATADQHLKARTCACGAPFSVAAPTRCWQCGTTLLDSYFHVAHPRP